ncbi:hypothetical protein NQ317_017878 [Molorchus minor]|uniref:DUF1758 domain-containing protein n=1 Tax=Molorchus minor TaxID=1323400 RepID=A0ABQ9JC19_9CUCU|nr:hypothetical protein NQ317_017878 [Molorchus minor]
MNEEVKKLIKKRGCVKGRLTLFKGYLDGIGQSLEGSTDQKLNEDVFLELESRFERLNSIWSDFNEIQTQIEISHDEFDEQLKERDLFEQSYYSVSIRCKKLLARNTYTSLDSVARKTGPKLPNIPVPKFKGLYENWLEYRDTFESLIHNNNSITDIEKFHFLRGSLEGDAKDVVHSLEFSAANYKVAWKMLLERYNNTSYLVNNHVKLLLSLPSLTRESATELRKLLDGMVKHLRSLNTLGQGTDTWDVLIIFLVAESLEISKGEKHGSSRLKVSNPHNKSHHTFVTTSQSCSFCKGGHYINNCSNFLKLGVYQRFEQAKRLKLCLNCLRINHVSKYCNSGGCKKCNGRHHTLLHYDKRSNDRPQEEPQVNEMSLAPSTSTDNPSVVMSTSNFDHSSDVFLSTALVQVIDARGYPHTCRILLDSGSQSHLITSELCSRLGLSTTKVNLAIIGVSQVVSEIQSKCLVKVQSLHNAFEKSISCLVVPKIGENIPSQDVNISHLKIPKHLKLADPNFHVPSSVDMLIGAQLFYELLCIGQISLGENMPILQKQGMLAKFWELEEPSSLVPVMSEDNKRCEEIFVSTTTRGSDGKFQVVIPFRESVEKLGDSRQHALSRFLSLENRLSRNPVLKRIGGESVEEVIKVCKEVDSILRSGCFVLRKWASNKKSSC